MAAAPTRVLERRFGKVPDSYRSRIAAAGMDELQRWLDRAIDARSLEAVFEPSVH